MSKEKGFKNKIRSLQHESLKLIETIEELVQSRSIKCDGRLTLRKETILEGADVVSSCQIIPNP
jgi:hypothetical protein